MSAQKCSALLNSKYTIKHNLDSFTLFLGAQNEYKFLILSLFPFSPFYWAAIQYEENFKWGKQWTLLFSNELKIFHIGRFWNRLLLTFLDSIAVSICEVILVDKQAESDTWAKSKKSNKAGSKTSKHRLLYIYMCV